MYYFCHMFPDILTNFINWQIIRINPKGVFNRFGNQFEGSHDIKDKWNRCNDEIAHRKDKTYRKCKHINEDKFFNKRAVGHWNGGIFYTFACPAYIIHGI